MQGKMPCFRETGMLEEPRWTGGGETLWPAASASQDNWAFVSAGACSCGVCHAAFFVGFVLFCFLLPGFPSSKFCPHPENLQYGAHFNVRVMQLMAQQRDLWHPQTARACMSGSSLRVEQENVLLQNKVFGNLPYNWCSMVTTEVLWNLASGPAVALMSVWFWSNTPVRKPPIPQRSNWKCNGHALV